MVAFCMAKSISPKSETALPHLLIIESLSESKRFTVIHSFLYRRF